MENITKINNFREEVLQCMAENGLPYVGDLLSDGKVHRYSADEKRSKPDEWYIAFEGMTYKNNPFFICIFGSWSDGSKYEYKSFENSEFSEDEKKEFFKILQQKRTEADRQRNVAYDQVAQKALTLWNTYSDQALSDKHMDYLKIKGISKVGDIKYATTPHGRLAIVIPLYNSKNEIRSLQYIFTDEDGSVQKRFLSGGETRGNFFVIGKIGNDDPIYVVEGYATGVSVHLAAQKPVIVAFSLWNIRNVIHAIQTNYSSNQIIIAADRDKPGKAQTSKEVKEVASQLGCILIFPKFPKETPADLTDFNDLHTYSSLDEVKKQLDADSLKQPNLKALAESFLVSKEDPCESFKLYSLPIPLREYIAVLCKTTNAHPIMVTSSVVTMVSAFLGTKVCVPEGEYFQNLYPNLWILCIAKSGQFKTTALNKGAKIAYEKQKEVFRSIKQLKGEDDENADLILHKSLENIVLPTKLTAEAFLDYLSEGHQGAVFASEFGGWLQNLDKTNNNDFKAILTDFYDVPSHYRYKTKTQGDCIISHPFVSICGVSTMTWIEKNLKPSDIPSGFFARFLLFVPPYQDDIPPAFPASLEENFFEEEEKFRNCLNNILDEIGESRVFHLTERAKDLIERFHSQIYLTPKQFNDNAEEILQPYLKRWSPYLIKLSMIMQLFIEPESEYIDTAAVIAGMSLLIPAMKSTGMLLEKELSETRQQRKTRQLFEWICQKIKESGKPVRRPTIMSSRQLSKTKEYDEILTHLIEEGRLGCNQSSSKKTDWEYYLVEEIE